MKIARNTLLSIIIVTILGVSSIVFIIFKKQQDTKMNENIHNDELEFKEFLQELGLSKEEMEELFARGERFEQAKLAFDDQQEALLQKYPEQLEEFVQVVSTAMFDNKFDETDPAIVVLIHEPVVAQFIAAWKNVHVKEAELTQKHPEFKEFLEEQHEEMLEELSEELEVNED